MPGLYAGDGSGPQVGDVCAAQNGIRQSAVGIVQDDGADGRGKTVGLQIVGISNRLIVWDLHFCCYLVVLN